MSIPIEEDVAPCPVDSTLVPVAELCGCDDPDFGPLCPRHCAIYHETWGA